MLIATVSLQLVPSRARPADLTGKIQVWHIYSLGLLGAFVEVFNWPARSAFIPRLVAVRLTINAMTLSTMILQLSFLVGPRGRVLIDQTGSSATYLFSALLLLPSLIGLFAIRASGKIEGERRRVNLRSIVEGVEFIWIQRIILSLFLLDFGVTLVGFYRPILPIFAADVFKTGASGLGILYAAPSVGSLLGSMTLLTLGDVRRKGVLVILAAVCFAGGLALLGIAQWFWMAVGPLSFWASRTL